jgi:hypothetical protein
MWPAPSAGAASTQLQWLADAKSETLALPLLANSVAPHGIRYLPSKKAYFISPTLVRSTRAPAAGCVAFVWLHTRDRRIEHACAPIDALSENDYTLAPSPLGIIRALNHRRTPHGPKPGGLYLTEADGKTWKIFEGQIVETNISPDQCLLAFSYRPPQSREPSLGVLKLCEAKRARVAR